jgi:excisionase family DNA binding protein
MTKPDHTLNRATSTGEAAALLPELLKIPEAARILNVSNGSIYGLIARNRLRPVKLLGVQRIPRGEINRLLADIGAL